MLTIGDTLPSYCLKGVGPKTSIKNFERYTEQEDKSSWKVYFFWPKDFTFVCPTEIIGFGELYEEFQKRHCQIYGVSTDSEFVHLAWRDNHPGLNSLPFPMLSDIKREFSQALGILHKEEGVCLRATFIVDPENIIRFVSVNDLSVGRNPQEVLRVLDGLQSGALTPCSWRPGEKVITL